MHIDPAAPYNDLPALPPRADLGTPAILKQCMAAKAALGELRQAVSLLQDPSILIAAVHALEACSSCGIDGIAAEPDSALRAMAAGKADAGSTEEHALLCVAALQGGMASVQSRYPLGLTAATQACSRIAGRKMQVRADAGSSQTSSSGAIVYTPPSDAHLIGSLLANWEQYLRSEDKGTDPLVRMAVAHSQFEAVQPFGMHTGRTARVLSLLHMADCGLLGAYAIPLSSSLLAQRRACRRSQAAIVMRGRWEDWIVLMLEAVEQAARQALDLALSARSLRDATEAIIASAAPQRAQARLHSAIYANPYCRIQNIIDAVGCTRITATKYLRELRNSGVLTEQRSGRDVLFANSAWLQEILPAGAADESSSEARSGQQPVRSAAALGKQCDTILFDINETVLDLASLREGFADAFGDSSAAAVWFAMLLQSSTVCALTGVKTSFAELAGHAIDNLAARRKTVVSDEQRAALLAGFATLRPHADVAPALERLREAGLRTVALTNSSRKLANEQISNAGLDSLFDAVISVEDVGSFKPAAAVYRHAAVRLSRAPSALRLVAAHDWDTHGALAAGLAAAYVDRTGAPYHPQYRKPDIMAADMAEAAGKILACIPA